MEATIQRKHISFRLRTDLLNFMKEDAQREKQSLNGFLERLLLDHYYNEPNEITKAAIKEAMNRKDYPEGKVYNSVEEMFGDILNED